MRHLLLTILALFMAICQVVAGDVNDLRIYINPGHGSWGPNGRPSATIPYPFVGGALPDTCGFYESNTNLWKAAKLHEKLLQAGVQKENLFYSRTANGPYPYVEGAADAERYDRNLSEICEEVDANNIDIFISIHSSAATDGTTTNYPLFFYRGTDGQDNDAVRGSRDMALAMWPLFYTNEIDPQSQYSADTPNVRGDISFYGASSTRYGTYGAYTGYLGVLKHGAAGVLCEGSFYTYQPARHRALNRDYCAQEGVRYARGMIEFLKDCNYDVKSETTGYIMGTVKDMHERIVNDLFKYAPGTNDQWLPVNGATVTLLKGGAKIGEYKVDNNYNGVFVFEGLEPGDDYTLDITADGYKPLFDQYKEPIAVAADKTTYPMVYLEKTDYVAPVIPYYNYPEPGLPGYVGNLPQPLNFTQTAPAAIEGVVGTVEKTLHYGDSVFVLARGAQQQATVYLVDRAKNSVQAMSMTDIDAAAIADIALTADGQLVASAQGVCKTGDDGTARPTPHVYRWLKPDDAPVEWIGTAAPASFGQATVGQAITVNGPSRDCKVVLSAVEQRTDGSLSQVALMQFGMTDATMTSAQSYSVPENLGFAIDAQHQSLSLRVSPRDDNNIIINADGAAPFEVAMPQDGGSQCLPVGQMADDVLGTCGAEADYFRYAHRAFMVAPYSTDADGTLQGLRLVDITQGLDKARVVRTAGTDVSGALASDCAVTAWADGESDIKAWLTNVQGLTTFASSNDNLPLERSVYAYGLGMSESGGNYTLTFKLTGQPHGVKVRVTATDDESRYKLFDVPGAQEGDNAVNISQYDIPEGECRWAVLVENEPVAVAQRVFESASSQSGSQRGGVAVVRDNNSAAYGKVVVSNGKNKGFDIYSPTLQHEGNWHAGLFGTNSSSTGRVTENGGLIYAADWGDSSSGFYVLDPSHPDVAPYQLYEGWREGSGAFHVGDNDEIIGGSATGCDFVGTGADRKMVAFVEDYKVNNKGNQLVMYAIGENRTIGFAPEKVYGNISGMMLNTYVEVCTLPQGMFVSQVRTAGNNSPGVPGFVFADYDGNILFNSGADFKDLNGSTAGLAVNDEGNLLAVGEYNVGIRVCQLEWGDGNVPKLTTLYHIKDSWNGAELTQLDFDAAGNLYAYVRGYGLKVFSVHNPLDPTPVATSPAPDALTLTGVVRRETLTTSAQGYATYAADMDVDYCALGLTVYTITVNDSQTMATAKEFMGVVPAGKAVLVKGEPNVTYTFEAATTEADQSFATSLQSGATVADGTQYGFTSADGTPAFKKVIAGQRIAEKKGYLVLDGHASGAKLALGFDGEATAIGSAVDDGEDDGGGAVYNIAGQRVDRMHKGIVIVNGRKRLNK